MLSFTDLELFTRTAALGSISQAARELNVTPATASASLKRLEKKLQVRLFVRSTRHLRLTNEGELFIDYCNRALDNLKQGIALLGEGQQQVRGAVRISASSDFGRQYMMGWINQFQQNYPQVEVTLLLSDRVSDFYRDSIDLAVRYGELQDSSLVARKLCDSRRILCAAPAYLEKNGFPETLQDLSAHNCLTFYLEQGIHDRWVFDRDGQQFAINITGDRRSDDSSVVRNWAVDGLGIAYRSWVDVAQDIQAGRLLHVLPQYGGEIVPIYMVYPYRQFMPASVRMLINHIREQAVMLPSLGSDN